MSKKQRKERKERLTFLLLEFKVDILCSNYGYSKNEIKFAISNLRDDLIKKQKSDELDAYIDKLKRENDAKWDEMTREKVKIPNVSNEGEASYGNSVQRQSPQVTSPIVPSTNSLPSFNEAFNFQQEREDSSPQTNEAYMMLKTGKHSVSQLGQPNQEIFIGHQATNHLQAPNSLEELLSTSSINEWMLDTNQGQSTSSSFALPSTSQGSRQEELDWHRQEASSSSQSLNYHLLLPAQQNHETEQSQDEQQVATNNYNHYFG